jgi:hypothetical protein
MVLILFSKIITQQDVAEYIPVGLVQYTFTLRLYQTTNSYVLKDDNAQSNEK